ncbi:MAG: GyrI-like domain-containing protein [bacterium]
MPTKLDLKKEYKNLYAPSAKEITLVNVPKFNYLSYDGHGDPNTAKEYQEAIQALYAVAYKIKFSSKLFLHKDFTVMPLEGFWWTPDMKKFSIKDKSNWLWKALIMQPDFITIGIFEKAVAEVKAKKALVGLEKLKLETIEEGNAAQILYYGSYSGEGETIQKIHDFIHASGGQFDGLLEKHHEIYLGDPRKTAPEKLKTIIRQAFRRK